MNDPSPIQLEIVRVGPDVVTIGDKRLLIDARHSMEDWAIRAFARKLIYFRDKPYYLRERTTAQPPFAVRYVLEPWPEKDPLPLRFCTYDEEAVLEREEAFKQDRFSDAVHYALVGFSPLLGFLWSGTKEKMVRFGFGPRSVTGLSIYFGFVFAVTDLILAEFGFGLVQWLLGARGAFADVLLIVLLVVDSVKRFERHFKNDDRDECWGFFEWLFVRRG